MLLVLESYLEMFLKFIQDIYSASTMHLPLVWEIISRGGDEIIGEVKMEEKGKHRKWRRVRIVKEKPTVDSEDRKCLLGMGPRAGDIRGKT